MTVSPTFRTLLTFETMFRRFTHNLQLDAMGTGTKQEKKNCGTGGRHGFVIYFVFLLIRINSYLEFYGT